MSEDVALQIPITADPNPLKQAMAGVKESVSAAMGGVKASMENVRLAMGAVGLVAAGYLKGAVESAAKAEQSNVRLKNLLGNQGQSWDKVKGQVGDYTQSVMKMSTYSAGEAKQALTNLLEKGVKYGDALKMQNTMVDLAAGKNMGLTEASNVLSDAYHGKTRALVGLGLATKEEIKHGISFEEVQKRINERFSGAASAQLDTYSGKMKQFNNEMDSLKVSIGMYILPHLNKLAEYLSGLAEKLSKLSPEMKKFITGALLATAAIGTLVGGLSVASKVSGILSPVLSQLGFEITSLTLPIAGVIAGIALLATGAYLVIKNWEPIKNFFKEVGDSIKNNLTEKFNDLKKEIDKHQTAIKATAVILGTIFGPALIKTGVQAAISGAQIAGKFIVSIVKSGAEAIISGAKLSASFIANIIKAGAQAVITGAQITIHLIAATISYAAEGWKAAAAISAQTVAWIANKVQIVIATGALVAHKVASIASITITGAMTAAQWALNVAMDANPIGIVIIAIGALVAAGVYLYKHWGALREKVDELWAGIKSAFINVGNHVINFLREWGPLILAAITGPIGLAVYFIATHFDQIKSLFSDLVNSGVKWGEGLINGFVDGIKNVAHKVKDAAGDVIKGVKDFMGFKSPSKEGEGRHIVEWGANMIGGFMDGVRSQLPNLKTLMSNAIQAPMLNANVRLGAIGGLSPAYAGAGNNSTSTSHQYIIQEGAIQINAKDIKEMKDVHTFFKNITPVLRQGVR